MAQNVGIQGNQPQNIPSKIPRYVRTQIPVSSLEYRNTLRSVRKKENEIAEIQQQIKTKKKELADRRLLYFGSTSTHSSDSTKTIDAPKCRQSVLDERNARRVIFTPGGTKRKGINNVKMLLFS